MLAMRGNILPDRLRNMFGLWRFMVRPAVDLPNPGCIVRTIALRTARSDLLHGNALL
jgi:hypothetical protein